MLDRAEDFLGKVTFITGPEKHCGKTTFMNRAAALARRGARQSGRPAPALLTVGYDGEARDFLSGARKPAVPLGAGDVFVTTERFARSGGSCPEILDALPGSTALGRLCVARATRDGLAALVGPEGNSIVAWALERILGEGMTDTVLVDGAINRVTQAASMPGARFVYVLRADKAGLARAVARVRRMYGLARLPLEAEASSDGRLAGVARYRLDDALTADSAARLPREAEAVVVEDFTKVFLTDAELAAFTRERTLYVARRVDFGGFVVSCRGLSNDEFISRLVSGAAEGAATGDLASMVAFNPYEETPEAAA